MSKSKKVANRFDDIPLQVCKTCKHCKTFEPGARIAVCDKSKMPFHIDALSRCIFFEIKERELTEPITQTTLF